MLDIKCLTVGAFAVNCYILSNSSDAAVIDPGENCDDILKMLGSANLKMILLTHGHFDHTGAVAELAQKTGAKIYIHKDDEIMLEDNSKNLSFMNNAPIDTVSPDEFLEDGQKLYIGKTEITVYHTPGHSAGSVSFSCDGCIFSGDLLFMGSIGRFDYGNFSEEMKSLEFLISTFEDDVKVYPGHGPATTIGYERKNNPYINSYLN